MSLAEAREKHSIAVQAVALGKDPGRELMENKAARKAEPVFSEKRNFETGRKRVKLVKICMGCKESEVQILSPRPMITHTSSR